MLKLMECGLHSTSNIRGKKELNSDLGVRVNALNQPNALSLFCMCVYTSKLLKGRDLYFLKKNRD